MRNAAILILLVTGRAVDGDPDTSTSESNLNCGSFL